MSTTTTINVRFRGRKRLPLLRVHGLLAPFAAMINMITLLVVIMWLFFKWTALAIYLGYSATAKGVRKLRAPRPAQFPKVHEVHHSHHEN